MHCIGKYKEIDEQRNRWKIILNKGYGGGYGVPAVHAFRMHRSNYLPLNHILLLYQLKLQDTRFMMIMQLINMQSH